MTDVLNAESKQILQVYNGGLKKVNGTEVIIVEINSLDKKQNLQDKHIQEIIQLLREKIVARVEHIHKKAEQQKGSKDSSGILTGTSVRIGYAFKNKPKNQTCLYSSDVMQLGNYSTDTEISSLKVVSEKLVVYVQLLVAGSPKGISQLLRRLSDVKHSAGNGVSISSYFQRVSTPQCSQTQSTTSKDTSTVGDTQSDDCMLMADFIEPCEAQSGEGKRRKIKDILQRGHVEGQKKHKQPIAVKHNECYDSLKTETESIVQYDKKMLHQEQIHLISKSEAQDKSIGKKVVELGTPDVTAHTDQKQCHTVDRPHSSDVSASEDMSGHSIKVLLENRAMEQECYGIKEGDLVRTSTLNVIKEMPGIEENLMFSSPEDSQTDSSDSDRLPSASFCSMVGKKRLSYFDSDTLKDILNVVESKKQPQQGHPGFDSKLGKHQVDILEKENNNESMIPSGATTIADCDSKKLAHGNFLKRFRYKRKFPKCFDSDSDDSLPDQKRQNIALKQDDKFASLPDQKRQNIALKQDDKFTSLPEQKRQNIALKQDNKFASLTDRKKKCKKLEISKDFFSESQTKSQTKLNVFTMNKNKNENIGNSDLKEPRQVYGDIPKLEIELNQELSDFPLIQNEANTELLKEIQCLSGVENLNEEQIRFLIRQNERYLLDIFKGKVKCERHDAYKKGGNCRRDLNHNSRLGPYSDEQIDIVMECLISIFCKKHHKYLDYIMKVLLTEMLIKFHMEVHKKSYEDSERLLAPKTPEHLTRS